MSQFSSLNRQKMVLFFSCFSIACEMNQLTQEGQHSQHAVMNQDGAWVGMHPDGKEGEEVLSIQ